MRNPIFVLLGVLGLAACATQEEILLGERLTLDGEEIVDTSGLPDQAPTLGLSSPSTTAEWTHANQNAQQLVSHAALSATPTLAWATQVTEREGRRHDIVAPPVVADGRIYVLGSRADVTALNTAGQVLWTRDLTPLGDTAGDASGGGLSYADGQLYASTGFGELLALDPSTGATRWVQDMQTVGVSAATVSGGLVYVTTRTGSAFALDPETGQTRWEIGGPESGSNLVEAPAPAITAKWALFPFATGELYSTFRQGGIRNWTAAISGRRVGFASSQIEDLTGGPVVSGNSVYVGNSAGAVVSLDLATGERRWTVSEGVLSRIIPAGNSLFFVNDLNELIRLSQSDGSVIWRSQMPQYTRDDPRRRDAVFVHFGPVLAGGRLIVASSDGFLRSFDPTTGALVRTVELPGPAAAAPSVANEALYVLTTDGRLTSFR